MKNYILGLVTSLILIAVFSFSSKKNDLKIESKAEEIPLIVKAYKSHEFYVEQAKLWQEYIKLNNKDENAWFNLFKANRYAKLTFNDKHSPELSWRENTAWIKEAPHLLEGKEIIKQIERNIPETFMSYYIKFYNSEKLGGEDFYLLEKAYAINPNFYEIYDDFITHYELNGNEAKRKEFNKKWFKSNDFSESLLNYNYNVLSSLKDNSVIFSFGDNDFFGPKMLQDALEFREDVSIVNIPMMISELEYRNSILKKLAIKSLSKVYEHGWSEKNMKEMITHMLTNKPKDLPVYFGMACNESLKKDFEDKLYLVGVVLEYSEENIDNLAELKNNFNNKYLLDYIKIQFTNDSYTTGVNVNYINGIACLYDHYKLSGDLTKVTEMRTLALTIADKIEGEHLKKYKEYAIHHFSK
jgi:hypothetical protein